MTTAMIFDPEMDAFLRRQAKAELRKRRRALRNSLPESARNARSERITSRVIAEPIFEAARTVALFWPMLHRNEVDVRPLDREARARGKRVAYPRLMEDKTDMTLFAVSDPSQLEERGNGFAEPPEGAEPILTGDDLLIIVPALAVDLRGHRIGYGRGYYDRLLAKLAPPAFALAVVYDFELVAEVPVTEGDHAVDKVITDSQTLTIERASLPTFPCPESS